MNITFTDFTMKLARSQLKNLAVVDDFSTGEINPIYEDQLLELTNQGLIDIFSKKKLLEGTAILNLIEGTNLYVLDTSPAADFEDYVRVLSVSAVKRGYDVIESNKRTFVPKSSRHITMPANETIRFSDDFIEEYGPAVDINFQKTHPEITLLDSINIPGNLLEALALYVSGLYLSHMGGEAHTAKGDSYYGLYLKMLSEDDLNNISGVSEVVDEDTRFMDRGFV